MIFGALLLAVWLVRPFWRLSSQFAEDGVDGLESQPSRLYGRPLALAVGGSLSRSEVLAELAALEYRAVKDNAALLPGSYRDGKDRLEVHLRSFPTPGGIHPGGPLLITFQGARVKTLSLGGQPLEGATLEPPLLASFMGPRFLERRPVRVEELPDHLVRAVLAAEDDQFFRHGGLSASGILRAAWRNVRGGEVRQGGSTLTQQLVKNLYLTRERTWARKAQEAVLALIVELRYSKREILQAYLNEIYLGQSGGVNLLGVGAAARAYFGVEPARLDLAQA
ncbi:MAG TPA: transglycosylase domain-containing protein, partial [Gemmatimonadales bacterium]|nr:transglycosylase domain-containing protein [Gemmatimonadales bacterium]